MSDSFINMNDFNSIDLRIEVANTSRNQQIQNPKFKITLIEFMENGLVLGLPQGAAEVGHYMSLAIEWTDSEGKKGSLHSGGKVIEAEKGRTAIELTQFKQEEWEALQALYSARQEEILNFFNAVKG